MGKEYIDRKQEEGYLGSYNSMVSEYIDILFNKLEFCEFGKPMVDC